MKILISLIKKSGAPSDLAAYRQKIAEGIRSLKGFPGITKAYTFQPNGELVPEAVKIYLYEVKGGDFTLVGAVDDLLGSEPRSPAPAATSPPGGSSPGASPASSPKGGAYPSPSPYGTASPSPAG